MWYSRWLCHMQMRAWISNQFHCLSFSKHPRKHNYLEHHQWLNQKHSDLRGFSGFDSNALDGVEQKWYNLRQRALNLATGTLLGRNHNLPQYWESYAVLSFTDTSLFLTWSWWSHTTGKMGAGTNFRCRYDIVGDETKLTQSPRTKRPDTWQLRC